MLLVNRVPPDVEGAVDERVDEGVGHAEEKYGLHQAVPELQQRNEWDYHRLQIFDLPSVSVQGDLIGCCTGNEEKLSNSQTKPEKAIKSDVA